MIVIGAILKPVKFICFFSTCASIVVFMGVGQSMKKAVM